MGTTTKGFKYPDSTSHTRIWEHFQTGLDDVDAYLTVKRVLAYVTAAISVANTGATLLTYTSEVYDTASMHSTSSNTSRFIAPVAGVYDLKVMVGFASNSSGRRALTVRKNSAGSSSGGTQIATPSVAPTPTSGCSVYFGKDVLLSANDYIEVFAVQTSAGALDVNAGEDITYVSMRLVEPT